jgi:copper resistance protein C
VPVSRSIAPALFGLMALLLPMGAWAHAILVQSSPATGATVPAGRLTLSFRFNSRIDRTRSRLILNKPDHTQSVLAITASDSLDTLQASLSVTAPGPYTVRWQVLAIDGHITRGDVAFTVADH